MEETYSWFCSLFSYRHNVAILSLFQWQMVRCALHYLILPVQTFTAKKDYVSSTELNHSFISGSKCKKEFPHWQFVFLEGVTVCITYYHVNASLSISLIFTFWSQGSVASHPPCSHNPQSSIHVTLHASLPFQL